MIVAAQEVLSLGWSKSSILEGINWVKGKGVSRTTVSKGMMIFNDRWIHYHDQPIEHLEKSWQARESTKAVTVWGDGSGTTDDKPAGIGVVIEEGGVIVDSFGENIGPGTNNRAELMAVYRGLQRVRDADRPVTVKTDSKWTIGALSQGWTITKNLELVTTIRNDLFYRKNVRFEHVKGHSGIMQNELCDQLAHDARVGGAYLTHLTSAS